MVVIPLGILLFPILIYLVFRYIRGSGKRTPTQIGREAYWSLPLHYLIDLKRNGHKLSDFTCCDCPVVATCRSRYDTFNLDGDCLEEK